MGDADILILMYRHTFYSKYQKELFDLAKKKKFIFMILFLFLKETKH